MSRTDESESIWYVDPRGFFDGDRLAHFIPERHSSFASQLNALLRLSLYAAAVLVAFHRYSAALYVPLGTAAFTYLMYSTHVAGLADADGSRSALAEGMTREGSECTVPTHDNPFMNVLMNEYSTRPERPVACGAGAGRTRRDAESSFADNLYRDVDDVFQRHTSSRAFYTMPNTQIPNDQGAFAEWCYKPGPTCKGGDGQQCFRNVDASTPPYIGSSA